MPILMVCMTSSADADAMFTLTVWHMMGTPPTDPGVLPTFYIQTALNLQVYLL